MLEQRNKTVLGVRVHVINYQRCATGNVEKDRKQEKDKGPCSSRTKPQLISSRIVWVHQSFVSLFN